MTTNTAPAHHVEVRHSGRWATPMLYSVTAIEILGTYLQGGWTLDRAYVDMYRIVRGDEIVEIRRV